MEVVNIDTLQPKALERLFSLLKQELNHLKQKMQYAVTVTSVKASSNEVCRRRPRSNRDSKYGPIRSDWDTVGNYLLAVKVLAILWGTLISGVKFCSDRDILRADLNLNPDVCCVSATLRSKGAPLIRPCHSLVQGYTCLANAPSSSSLYL
jgi:hypothetical protein